MTQLPSGPKKIKNPFVTDSPSTSGDGAKKKWQPGDSVIAQGPGGPNSGGPNGFSSYSEWQEAQKALDDEIEDAGGDATGGGPDITGPAGPGGPGGPDIFTPEGFDKFRGNQGGTNIDVKTGEPFDGSLNFGSRLGDVGFTSPFAPGGEKLGYGTPGGGRGGGGGGFGGGGGAFEGFPLLVDISLFLLKTQKTITNTNRHR